MDFSKSIEDIIADFRGLPRTTSESSKHAPIQIVSVLKQLEEKHQLQQPSAERILVENWNNIFGGLAGRCNPVCIKSDRVLIISVNNQTLRSELQFRKHGLLKKIQALPHCENICELLFKS